MLFGKVIFPLIDNCTEQQGGTRGRWSTMLVMESGEQACVWELNSQQRSQSFLWRPVSLQLNVRGHSWSACSFHLMILTFPVCVTVARFPLVQWASFGIRWVIMSFLASYPILISVLSLTRASRSCLKLSAFLSTESLKLVWLDSKC